MATHSQQQPAKTAIVLIDPLNEFLHPKGKLYPLLQQSIAATDTNAHMKALVNAARELHLPIFYALHQEWKEGNYFEWIHMTPSAQRISENKVFAEGSFGAEIVEGLEPDVLGNHDVVASRHWNSR